MVTTWNPPPNWPPAPAGWTPQPGFMPDPAWGPAPTGWPLWIDQSAQVTSAPEATYQGPARNAHGLVYWLLAGWWWEPITWAGRMLCYLIPPLGIWRSARHGRKNREARERRGYK